MSHKVGGPPPDQPLPDPNPKGAEDKDKVQALAEQVLSANPGPAQPPSLSERVTFPNRELREKILRDWVESQPENAKAEAAAIVDILGRINLDEPFELDLSNKSNITSLPDVLQNCKALGCYGCTSLQALPALPECRELNCSGCSNLRTLPALPLCTELNCSFCTSLQSLPELTLCEKLGCRDCISLQSLPALPACRALDCINCTSLETLPELPVCTRLDCTYCINLEVLPYLPVCTVLKCDICTKLRDLPELPACSLLVCADCTTLQALPALPLCTELNCRNCTRLEILPELPLCTKLNCHNCTSLHTVLELPVCTRLNCSRCTILESLPELPLCTELNCSRCTGLETLPALPVCRELRCPGCTSLESLPELPACKRLVCPGCTNLQTLPELPVCEILACSECAILTLPELEACKKLCCSGCSNLQSLPELPLCVLLDCAECASLEFLPALPECRELYCHDCTGLRTLPELPLCTELNCHNCTSLETLPELPVCTRLNCSRCTSLVALPALSLCTYLDCSGCTSLQTILELPVCEVLQCDNCPLLPQMNRQQNLYQALINRAAEGTLQKALSFWGELLPAGQEPLDATTLRLNERDQRSFQIFLNRLQETADFLQVSPQDRPNFALRVARIVRDMAASEEFREKAIMALGGANDACGDRVATGINDLELLSLQYGQNKPQDAVDTAFLAVRLARLDQVRKKAIELNSGSEGLETVLFLELALKDRLQLPLQTQNMRYSALGRVEDDVVYRTAQEILDATSTNDQVCEILIASSVWTDFLLRQPNGFYQDVEAGFTIIAREGGTDYPANLADLEQNPNRDWTEFLDRVGPLNISPEDRKALQEEVLQTLREACIHLKGKEYASALSQLIRQIHRKKTIEWLGENFEALRAKIQP